MAVSSLESLASPKPVGAARKAEGTLGRGGASLSVAAGAAGRSYLDTRYFSDPFRIFTPRTTPGEPLSLVSSTLSGGLVGGDQLRFSLDVQAGAAAQMVGQAAEKIYGSNGALTEQDFELRLAESGWLEWVPQETILFDQARLERRFSIQTAAQSRALVGDMVVLGRLAMGEHFADGAFSDTWRLEIDGELVWMDRFGFEGAGAIARGRGDAFGLSGAEAFATVVYAGPEAERAVELLRTPEWDERVARAGKGLRMGVTCLGPCSVVRVVGSPAHELRRLLGDIWKHLRAEMGGYRAELPALWSI